MNKMKAGNFQFCTSLPSHDLWHVVTVYIVLQSLHATKQSLYLSAAAVLLLSVVANQFDGLCIAILKPIRKHVDS